MIKKIILSLVLLISMMVQAADLDGYKINLSLPINDLSKPIYNLYISTPNEYSPIQPIKMFYEGQTSILEFIPKGDSVDNWSKLLTIQMERGKLIKADIIIPYFKNNFKKLSSDVKILEENIIDQKGYRKATLAISYKYEGRQAVVYMEYYSGPLDMAGVQYATVLKNDEDPKSALNSLKAFVQQHVKVISF